jgi:hypothetical protein
MCSNTIPSNILQENKNEGMLDSTKDFVSGRRDFISKIFVFLFYVPYSDCCKRTNGTDEEPQDGS